MGSTALREEGRRYFTHDYAHRWPGRHEASFLGLQQGCSETKIASGGDDFRAERKDFREYFVVYCDNYSQCVTGLMLGIGDTT